MSKNAKLWLTFAGAMTLYLILKFFIFPTH